MVSDAAWLDINKDGWPDLVAVGMFMPITIFENHNGSFQNKTKEYGLAQTNGWWCRIVADDFNNDGNIDLVAGNLGNNTAFRATEKEPLSITYADFNGDGVIDPILSFYNQGKSYPYFSRDEIFEQLPLLQKKFGRYSAYADAQVTDMFTEEQLQTASTIDIKNLSSAYLSNDGKGHFSVKALPAYAQWSMAAGIIAADIDKDGNKDLVITGNCFPMRVQLGPLDAGIGLVLKGDGKGNFTPLPYQQTGLYVPGDVRSMIELKTGRSGLLVAAKCNGPVQAISIN
jgi:hypothetical protein